VSTNGGDTWHDFGQTDTHTDQHALEVNPSNPNEFLLGNDGGVYKFTLNPETNTFASANLNRGLPITEFRSGAWHPTSKSRMLGGTQDNKTAVATGQLDSCKCVFKGDGAGCGIDPNHTETQFATKQNYDLDPPDKMHVSFT